MQVVQVWSEAQPLDGAVDVGPDMRSGVCDAEVAEDVEATLGSDFTIKVLTDGSP